MAVHLSYRSIDSWAHACTAGASEPLTQQVKAHTAHVGKKNLLPQLPLHLLFWRSKMLLKRAYGALEVIIHSHFLV